mgnify:CR=1 FL=1
MLENSLHNSSNKSKIDFKKKKMNKIKDNILKIQKRLITKNPS